MSCLFGPCFLVGGCSRVLFWFLFFASLFYLVLLDFFADVFVLCSVFLFFSLCAIFVVILLFMCFHLTTLFPFIFFVIPALKSL